MSISANTPTEDFNLSNCLICKNKYRDLIKCIHCNNLICYKCIEDNLLNQFIIYYCPLCNKEWNFKFICQNLTKNFINNKLLKKYGDLCFDFEKQINIFNYNDYYFYCLKIYNIYIKNLNNSYDIIFNYKSILEDIKLLNFNIFKTYEFNKSFYHYIYDLIISFQKNKLNEYIKNCFNNNYITEFIFNWKCHTLENDNDDNNNDIDYYLSYYNYIFFLFVSLIKEEDLIKYINIINSYQNDNKFNNLCIIKNINFIEKINLKNIIIFTLEYYNSISINIKLIINNDNVFKKDFKLIYNNIKIIYSILFRLKKNKSYNLKFKCFNNNCIGNIIKIDNNYKCDLCDKYFCIYCHNEIFNNKEDFYDSSNKKFDNIVHICQDNNNKIQLLNNNIKKCPNCQIDIYKINNNDNNIYCPQ